MQTRINRQRMQPLAPPRDRPLPLLAHLTKDRDLTLIQARDRGGRTDVRRLRGRIVSPAAADVPAHG
jgi:hypothetical protein